MRKQLVAITALVVLGVSATAVAVWATNKPPPTQVVVVTLPQISVPAPQPQPLFAARHLTVGERAAWLLENGDSRVDICAKGPPGSTSFETHDVYWVIAKMRDCASIIATSEALSDLSSN